LSKIRKTPEPQVSGGWETDKPSNSRVVYGIENLNLSSASKNNYTQYHEVTLAGMEPRRIYRYSIISEDMFGNRSESKVFTFSTDNTFSIINDSPAKSGGEAGEIVLYSKIYKYGDRYTVNISANGAVTMAIGIIT